MTELVGQYLFVLSRDIGTDPSALYTLRSALALRRREQEVAVFLIDDACASVLEAEGEAVLNRLVAAGVDVYAGDETVDRLARVPTAPPVQRASDRDLGALMLRPLVTTLWC